MIYGRVAYWLAAGSILGAGYFFAGAANQLAYRHSLLNALVCMIVAGGFAAIAMILAAAIERNAHKKRACRLADATDSGQTGVGTID